MINSDRCSEYSIICPYCNYQHTDELPLGEDEGDLIHCDCCGCGFFLDVDITRYYSSYSLEETLLTTQECLAMALNQKDNARQVERIQKEISDIKIQQAKNEAYLERYREIRQETTPE